MTEISRELRPVYRLLERLHGKTPGGIRLYVTPMRGGLEASSVFRVRADFKNGAGRHRTFNLVVKRPGGAAEREAAVYHHLVARHAQGIAPRLLEVDLRSGEPSLLYLEWVRPVRKWPWRHLPAAEDLVVRLARLHMSTAASEAAALLPQWDYDADLARSSETTLDLLARCRRDPDLAPLARHLPAARSLTLALPALRRQLLAFDPLGTVAIHGDVHPGNALLRRRAGAEEPILIDWGRARAGSPLEDLSGWLQSLGYWEQQARRRHDTLLAAYLTARGMERRLTSDLRAAYWLAGASNALSGALEYYLSLLIYRQAPVPSRRLAAARAARDWLRILRRARAVWQ